MASVACLIVMPDQCTLPDRKRKSEGELPRVASIAKSDSASSLASCRSDAYSKASEASSASSNCSFKPVVSRSPGGGKESGVRIAIGGA
jgi:hypothetical protein